MTNNKILYSKPNCIYVGKKKITLLLRKIQNMDKHHYLISEIKKMRYVKTVFSVMV